MITFILCTLLVLIPALLLFSAVVCFKRMSSGTAPRKAARFNIGVFACLIVIVALTSVSVFAAGEDADTAGTNEQAQAADEAVETETASSDSSKGMGLLAAGTSYRSCRHRRRYRRCSRCACRDCCDQRRSEVLR